ncbi:MAG: TolC family protein [Chloroherpetonaceae bacterium]
MLKIRFYLLLLLCSEAAIAQPLSLRTAIERALKDNLAIKRQVELQASAEARTLITLSPEKPVVSYYTEDMLNSPTDNQVVRRWQVSQGFDFPLTTYYRARAQSSLASAIASETEELKCQVAADVRIAYMQVALATALERLSQENLAISQRFYEMSKRLYEIGEVSELQMLRARTELVRAENALTEARMQVAESRRALVLKLGNLTDTSITLVDSLRETFVRVDIEQLAQTMSQSRPLLTAIQAKQESAEEAQAAAYSALFPSLRLTLFQQRFTPAFNPNQNFYGGEIALSVPLWFWLGERGEIAEKSALLHAQRYESELIKRQVETEWRNAVSRYESARLQAERATEEELIYARRAFIAAERQLQVGAIGYIEYLEAKRTYFEAEKNALEKRFDAERAFAQLLRTIGIINLNDQ